MWTLTITTYCFNYRSEACGPSQSQHTVSIIGVIPSHPTYCFNNRSEACGTGVDSVCFNSPADATGCGKVRGGRAGKDGRFLEALVTVVSCWKATVSGTTTALSETPLFRLRKVDAWSNVELGTETDNDAEEGKLGMECTRAEVADR